ncbi:MAG: glycosyltransferase family 39 protein [Planctomycetes bacterium]|nr:glycosyltransferase family 39 protein [Planctomycetota bacterium]MCH9726578.1 glycosyltransferase family 39 protein [Planctomycetota bacterium]MCH9779247.1 glycosyltransferase family 39 protein [Planctomycetota bacterium]
MASFQNLLQTSKGFWSIIASMLLIQFCLGLYSAQKLTVTHDEYWHLPVGLLSLKTGKFDYDRLNPPLIRTWSAIPLLFTSAQTGSPPHSSDPADYGDAFVRANPESYHHYYVLGRCSILFLSVISGILLAIWARELFGTSAACLAVFLWSMSPNILANAALGTQDLAITGFFLATVFCGWKFSNHLSWKWAVFTGVALGLAQLTKFTAILLIPILIIQWFLIRYKNTEIKSEFSQKMILARWLTLLLLSCFVLNVGFLFQDTIQPISNYQFQSSELKTLNELPALLQNIPLPIPRDYLMGFDLQRFIMQQDHPTYLNNQWELHGFRSYYLYALFYKLPHSVQFLLLLAIYQWFKLRNQYSYLKLRTLGMLITPVILLMLIASFSNNQLGVRYILPVFPFFFLLIAPLAENLDFNQRKLFSYLVIVAIISLPLSLRFAPAHLAYFNELSGGPENGDLHLIDSNLDWGQDLYHLKEYLRDNQIDDLKLAYFGTIPPSTLGIKYNLPLDFIPEPGRYAISASILQGRPYSIRKQDGSRHNLGADALGFFRFFEPKAQLGYSINLYELSPQDVIRWQTAVNRANRGLFP